MPTKIEKLIKIEHDIKKDNPELKEYSSDVYSQPEETNMLCAYCNKKRTGKMLTSYDYCMGSERTGVYGEEVGIAIYCEHCGKLLYQKTTSL